MGQEKLYIEKELSWLAFNERVLEEAADKSNPLIERMRFLGIYSNNLDEFYKVRFAELKRRIIISEEQGSNSHSRHLLGKNPCPRIKSRSGIRRPVQRVAAGDGAQPDFLNQRTSAIG